MDIQIIKFVFWIVLAAQFGFNQCLYSETIHVSSENIRIKYQTKDKTSDFTQIIQTNIFVGIKSSNCSPNHDRFCLNWGKYGQLRIDRIDARCENYQFRTSFDKSLTISFDFTNTGMYLYGGEEIDNQTWPIRTNERKLDSFVAKERNSFSIMEPIWFLSNGFYVQVLEIVPLFVDYTENTMKFIAERKPPYIRGSITHLNYKICQCDDMKKAFKHAIAKSLGRPLAPPDYKMVELPIWSTWAKYKAAINESTILEFANDISSHLLPNSQLEIDDMWETCYGSLTVDKKRFPDMRGLVEQLHDKGYRVTMWVHPFVNVDCPQYLAIGEKNGYFVKAKNGSVVNSWWNGKAASIDFTNPEAVDWYVTRLQNVLDETGIDSYKFDAGELSWAPQPSYYHLMADDHPHTLTKKYIETAASFGPLVEVRSARQTQKYPIFVRMIDRETRWTGRLSLNTIIPEVLHMNLIGYPYVLPDMIGGNGYGEDKVTKEMFIRWLQINVFLPSIQFSYPPWDFDDEVITLTRKFIELHRKYASKIYNLMEQAPEKEIMVNAPIWWLDPTDRVAQTISSEFLLGEDTLVAPVLEKGAVSRDIYFPKGVWRDENIKGASLITGPKWVRNYPAPLQVLPYFTKVDSPSSSSTILVPSLLLIFVILFSFHCK